MSTAGPNAPHLTFRPYQNGRLDVFTAQLVSSRMWREPGHHLDPHPGSPWVGAIFHGELSVLLMCAHEGRSDTIRARIWRSGNPFKDSLAVVDSLSRGEWRELLRLPMNEETMAVMGDDVITLHDAEDALSTTALTERMRTAFLTDFHKLLNEAAVLLGYAAPGFTGFNDTEDERW